MTTSTNPPQPPNTATPSPQPKPPNASIPNPLPPNTSIRPLTPSTLPPYRRLLALLLPIRYTDSFFHAALNDPTSIALCAIYDPPTPTPTQSPKQPPSFKDQPPHFSIRPTAALRKKPGKDPQPTVVGAIQCRLEPLSPTKGGNQTPRQQKQQQLYVQTLAVLSPHRSLGIATALLESAIRAALARFDNVASIYAHVWERNEEALSWYLKRGFGVQGGVVGGYYRKLRPGGARVVRRGVGVGDYVRARSAGGGGGLEVGGVGSGQEEKSEGWGEEGGVVDEGEERERDRKRRRGGGLGEGG